MRRTFLSSIILAVALSCSPEPEGSLDPLAPAPLLLSVAPLRVTVDSDTINVGSSRLPTDVLEIRIPLAAAVATGSGRTAISEVSAVIADDRGVEISGPFIFNDRGAAPDATAGDGTFAGLARFSIERVEIGTWTARVAAKGANGTSSTIAVVPVTVVRNNRPPVLSDLQAASSISASDPQPLTQLRVRAVDPDGPTDILRVFFNSFLPSGQPANGNPFLLFDDGNSSGVSGDTMQGDSVYSLKVQFGGAPAGTYRFEFRAIDRSSDTSNAIIHFIQVLP